IRLQTGSVATSITLTPSFATEAGLDLTPSNPTKLQLTVPSTAPKLLAAAITSATSNGFIVTVAGYTTPRALSTLDFQFTFASGVNVPVTKATLDVSSSALLWFQNTQSQGFGGQFTVAVPFTMRVSSGTLESPIDKLMSVSVTATNSVGTSNSVTAALQ